MKKHGTMMWLADKIRRRLPAVYLMTGAQMIQAALGVVLALGMRKVIDAAVAGNRQSFLQAALLQGAILAGMLMTQFLVRFLREKIHADLDRDWKKQLLGSLLRGEYEAVSAWHSAELINRLNNDVRIVDEGVLNIVPSLASMAVRLLGALGVLFALDPVFAGAALILGSVAIMTTGFLRTYLKALHRKTSEQDGVVSAFLQEIMEKMLVIQAMDVSEEVERRADILLEQRHKAQRKRKNVSVAAGIGVSLLTQGAACFALIWCAFRLLTGQMSFGSLTAVTQLMGQLRTPFVGFSGVVSQYAAMTAATERLMELDRVPGNPAAMTGAEAEKLYERMQTIEAEGLTYGYDRDQVLNDLSFCLPRGSFTAITGPSGIGKSTILKLMLGMFAPDAGSLQVRCDGEAIAIDRRTRKLFAYVPQGNLLFSGTIRENLLLVNPDANEEQVRLAIYTSGMDEFLKDLPGGLDTLLGESGSKLSEGQAQRVAIARAVLSDAPVLLLDECTSAMDAELERKVLGRIRGMTDKTCIAVTHRDAALDCCDFRIDLTENGFIVRKTGVKDR